MGLASFFSWLLALLLVFIIGNSAYALRVTVLLDRTNSSSILEEKLRGISHDLSTKKTTWILCFPANGDEKNDLRPGQGFASREWECGGKVTNVSHLSPSNVLVCASHRVRFCSDVTNARRKGILSSSATITLFGGLQDSLGDSDLREMLFDVITHSEKVLFVRHRDAMSLREFLIQGNHQISKDNRKALLRKLLLLGEEEWTSTLIRAVDIQEESGIARKPRGKRDVAAFAVFPNSTSALTNYTVYDTPSPPAPVSSTYVDESTSYPIRTTYPNVSISSETNGTFGIYSTHSATVMETSRGIMVSSSARVMNATLGIIITPSQAVTQSHVGSIRSSVSLSEVPTILPSPVSSVAVQASVSSSVLASVNPSAIASVSSVQESDYPSIQASVPSSAVEKGSSTQTSGLTSLQASESAFIQASVPPSAVASVSSVQAIDYPSIQASVPPFAVASVASVQGSDYPSIQASVPPSAVASVSSVQASDYPSVQASVPPSAVASVSSVQGSDYPSIQASVPPSAVASVSSVQASDYPSIQASVPLSAVASVSSVQGSDYPSVQASVPPSAVASVSSVQGSDYPSIQASVPPSAVASVSSVQASDYPSIQASVPLSAVASISSVQGSDYPSVQASVPPSAVASVSSVQASDYPSIQASVPPSAVASVSSVEGSDYPSIQASVPPSAVASVSSVQGSDYPSVQASVPPSAVASISSVQSSDYPSVQPSLTLSTQASVSRSIHSAPPSVQSSAIFSTQATVSTSEEQSRVYLESTPTISESLSRFSSSYHIGASDFTSTMIRSQSARATKSESYTISSSHEPSLLMSSQAEVSTAMKSKSIMSSIRVSQIPKSSSASVFASTKLIKSSISVERSRKETTLLITRLISTSIVPGVKQTSSKLLVSSHSTPILTSIHRATSTRNVLEPSSIMTSTSILPSTSSWRIPTSSSVTTPTSAPTPTTPVSSQTYEITLEGDCAVVLADDETKKDFRDALKAVLAKALRISPDDIKVGELECGSIKATVTVQNAEERNVTQRLEEAVKNDAIVVESQGRQYKALKVDVVEPHATGVAPTEPSTKGLAFILYVSFGALMGLIFIVGVIVLCHRCRKDKTSGRFTMGQDSEVELKRFAGIPRATYYRVDFYGHAQEIDAVNDLPGDKEYDEAVVPYHQSFRLDDTGGAGQGGDTNQGGFTMGRLPEWDVPKLKSDDIVVASEGEKGAKEKEGGNTAHAYDNPAMSFGDLTDAKDKKENEE
ncbi:mucin-5AC [Nematostella vectensis]|uniref:mucin-5AC n=1 Tax=Nematostella vectensis TaxID=45351 RepID=UPI0020777EEE|nr:mucin-5AC [Nematostella vectensis]